MQLDKDSFMQLAKTLYNSDEYNKAICELAYTRDTAKYSKNLLTVLKIEQNIIKIIENE